MRALTLLALLAIASMTSGCQTLTTERIATEADASIVARICADAWKPVTYDSTADSPATVAGNRANNRARAAFCGEAGVAAGP